MVAMIATVVFVAYFGTCSAIPTELQKIGLFGIAKNPQQSGDRAIEAAAIALALLTLRRVFRGK